MEDSQEPKEAFTKVIGNKVGFEDYFLNKLLLRERLLVLFKNPATEAKIQLFIFYLLRCYGRLKHGKIQRTNGIVATVYFTRVVANERKFSWR